MLSSTSVSNVDIKILHIRMIFEGSCDTEDRGMMLKIQLSFESQI